MIERTAELSGEPRSMRSRVMLLRKKGLLSSEGQGISANAIPSDATNLFLSVAGGGLVTKIAETVRDLRKSKNVLNNGPDPSAATLPPVCIFSDLKPGHTLGDMLDRLFANWAAQGGLWSKESDLPVTNMSLTIERNLLGWDTELWLDDGNKTWNVEYIFQRINLGLSREELNRAVHKARKEEGGFTKTVGAGLEVFSAMAECVSLPAKRKKAEG